MCSTHLHFIFCNIWMVCTRTYFSIVMWITICPYFGQQQWQQLNSSARIDSYSLILVLLVPLYGYDYCYICGSWKYIWIGCATAYFAALMHLTEYTFTHSSHLFVCMLQYTTFEIVSSLNRCQNGVSIHTTWFHSQTNWPTDRPTVTIQ